MTTSQWVAFEPRDTIMIRDGRRFNAGTDPIAEPTLPGPNTVAGAVHAAYGGADPDRVRGPLFARRSDDQWTPLLPVPRDIVVVPDGPQILHRLRPRDFGDIVTDLPYCPQWLVGEGEAPAEQWVTGDALGAYLDGTLFGRNDDALTAERETVFGSCYQEPLVREPRIGLARDLDRHARDGLLYQSTQLRPRKGFTVLAQCDLPTSWAAQPAGPVPFGGRGRLADVSVATGVDWPAGPPEFPDGKVLLYLATPAIWTKGWRLPEVPAGADFVAAAVAGPVPAATASPRQGMAATRALRWMVPAGSVYLLRFRGDVVTAAERARAWAQSVHGCEYGMAVGRQANDKLVTAGYGVVLTGVWS